MTAVVGVDECPFCAIAQRRETKQNRQADVVLRDAFTTAFVSPKWWDSSPGHVIVIPNHHYENLYEIPDDALGAVYATAKRVAVALKAAYKCDGTSTRQHNEAGGGQDVWHFHVHVFPRYTGDRLYENNDLVTWTQPDDRTAFAAMLRSVLAVGDAVS
jgi:histidine triad (HIT) family protein